jgi:hypothetical protein
VYISDNDRPHFHLSVESRGQSTDSLHPFESPDCPSDYYNDLWVRCLTASKALFHLIA